VDRCEEGRETGCEFVADEVVDWRGELALDEGVEELGQFV